MTASPKKKTTAKKAPTPKQVADKIAADSRTTYYKALENEFRALVRDACEAKDWQRVREEFLQYGTYLQSRPDALAVK